MMDEEDSELEEIIRPSGCKCGGIKPGTDILMVEDDPYLTFANKLLFKDTNFAPHFSSNGEEACSVIQKIDSCPIHAQIKLLITDINMPIMGGIELVKKIKMLKDRDLLKKQLPYLVASSAISQEEAKEA
jgi:CheY-like chemotaxis protein